MIFRATTEYAIRALAHLAMLPPGERMLARDLAEVAEVPRQFLGKILHRLAQEGLLDSAKGRGGGFMFKQQPASVRVKQVVDIFEKNKVCVLGMHDCNDEQPCPMHDEWVVFRKKLTAEVDNMTFDILGKNLRDKLDTLEKAGLLQPTPPDLPGPPGPEGRPGPEA